MVIIYISSVGRILGSGVVTVSPTEKELNSNSQALEARASTELIIMPRVSHLQKGILEATLVVLFVKKRTP